MQIYYSEALGLKFRINRGFIGFSDRVLYYPDEVEIMRKQSISDECKKSIHLAKRMFQGTVINHVSKAKFQFTGGEDGTIRVTE